MQEYHVLTEGDEFEYIEFSVNKDGILQVAITSEGETVDMKLSRDRTERLIFELYSVTEGKNGPRIFPSMDEIHRSILRRRPHINKSD